MEHSRLLELPPHAKVRAAGELLLLLANFTLSFSVLLRVISQDGYGDDSGHGWSRAGSGGNEDVRRYFDM